ncbi:MAG: SAM-dependent methyltransferase [Planctomycetes bacterium]|nr:SAM-dependent methyltransferase [Planctomycetota bacterium]
MRAHLVLEQIALRRRASEKFTRASQMFFTPLGLEQATGEAVARYKASRFPDGSPVADLCCGIGGDLLSLCSRGPAVGIDRDPVKTLLAEANCRTLETRAGGGATQVMVQTADISAIPLADFAAWHLDPDRRATGRRTTRVEAQEPGPEVIDRLLAEVPHAAIKLAPASHVPDNWSQQAEREWISYAGQCRQQVAWFGELAVRPGRRAATVIGASRVRTLEGRPGAPPPAIAAIGRYLFEPDAAVLAAGLIPSLCVELGLSAISTEAAYLTGDHPAHDAAAQCFEVIDVLPFDVKRIKALLRERGVGRLEVKKRGVPHDPEQIRRQLRVPGDESCTLLLARVRNAVTAILARRLVG